MSYLLFVLPAMLLGVWAQWRVKSAYSKASGIGSDSGMTGVKTAQAILDQQGITNVGIEMVPGKMSDHYDPRAKMLRLSPDVYQGSSLASLGIAAHEVGHAIQDAKKYKPLVLRNGIVPLASNGSRLGMIVLMAGFALQSLGLIWLGVGLFSLTVVFQLINLPVEFDASSRAKDILVNQKMISEKELSEVDSVLDAAAMTYVAATISSISTMLYYLMRAGVFRRR